MNLVILQLVNKYIFLAISILLSIIVYRFAVKTKNKIKQKYIQPFQKENDLENSEFYIEYYKKIQQVNIYSTIFFFIIFLIVAWHENIQASSILAVATWALILTFQNFLISFVVYFLVMSDYKIWDTIKIWDDVQWEIISIKPLYTNIVGKNETTEHNGKLFRVPNYQIRQNIITKIDLSNDATTKIILTIRYDKNKYTCDLIKLTLELNHYLDKLFVINTLENAKNYKSYIWHKYKINYEPHLDGDINILIWYIANNNQTADINKNVLWFVETFKK